MIQNATLAHDVRNQAIDRSNVNLDGLRVVCKRRNVRVELLQAYFDTLH
jgi:hypothetical protein